MPSNGTVCPTGAGPSGLDAWMDGWMDMVCPRTGVRGVMMVHQNGQHNFGAGHEQCQRPQCRQMGSSPAPWRTE